MEDKSLKEERRFSSDTIMHYRANQSPNMRIALLMGFQQTMVCISGILVIPNLVSDLACAGSSTLELRARLISSSLVVTGVTTLLQTLLGLRLSILQGPSFAFIPPLWAFSKMPNMACRVKISDTVPEMDYLNRLQIISGSLFCSSLCLTLIGITGLISVISKRIGPLTISPLMILLCIGNVPLIIDKASLHWLSLVQFSILLMFAFFLADMPCKLPYINKQGLQFCEYRLFGLFPYLLSILITWLFSVFLTVTNIEPVGSVARVDRNESINVLKNSHWFQLTYPGQFGFPRFSLGLFLGFLTSCMACTAESLGAYYTLARISVEKPPPSRTLNRAILIEGIGCCLSALFGCGVGVTTYSENIAVVAITRVASRFVMQVTSVLLIMLGLFGKFGALLATIPDPVIGGVFGMSVCLVCSVSFSNLQPVDLKISRNLTILGLATILGISLPEYIEQNPIDTGVKTVNEMLNVLLTTRMFVGALIACLLDNTSGGATPEQRGLLSVYANKSTNKYEKSEDDGYSFDRNVNRFLLKIPRIHLLPFMPSRRRLEASVYVTPTKVGEVDSKPSNVYDKQIYM